jgi:hypothetical protein
MHILKSIFEAIVSLIKRAWRFLQLAASAIKQQWCRFALNALEAERLDRIRNPSKYLGKG